MKLSICWQKHQPQGLDYRSVFLGLLRTFLTFSGRNKSFKVALQIVLEPSKEAKQEK